MDLNDKPNGMYFDMPAADYLAIPRLSGSTIKQLLVSPATFWAQSWMNPHRAETSSSATNLGTAYHTAALEPDRLDAMFVRKPDPADLPDDALCKDQDYRKALAERGEPQTKAGEAVLDRARRLIAAGETRSLWHVYAAQTEDGYGDRIPLDGNTLDQMARDIALLHGTPEIAALFTGGCAEVAVLFDCPLTGEPMKCRIDYLSASRIVELKTFSNPRRARLDQAIADAVRYERYYVSAELYVQAIAAWCAEGGSTTGYDGPPDVAIADPNLVGSMPFTFVFQETGGVPNVLARRLALRGEQDGVPYITALAAKAQAEIRYAVTTFRHCREVYGTDGAPWQPLNLLGELSDADFNPYWLDGDNK